MRDNYISMRLIHVNMRLIYVHMQENLSRMLHYHNHVTCIIMISHVDTIKLHFNINMLHVDIDISHLNMII